MYMKKKLKNSRLKVCSERVSNNKVNFAGEVSGNSSSRRKVVRMKNDAEYSRVNRYIIAEYSYVFVFVLVIH